MKLFAKKSLGQHFLNSPSALSQIISGADLKPGETVLEIGPGTGILTKKLLETSTRVVAIEKDPRAISLLQASLQTNISSGSLNLVEGDILETDLGTLGLEDQKYALVANIPYYITGAILEKFLEYKPRPNRIVLLVQKEVAERIVARDGKESLLSISVKTFGKPRIIAKVPRGAFTPPPTVDSAILAIESISAQDLEAANITPKRYFEIVRAGFAHKRKYLIRNLESVLEKSLLLHIWEELKLDAKVRVEDIQRDIWLQIVKLAEK